MCVTKNYYFCYVILIHCLIFQKFGDFTAIASDVLDVYNYLYCETTNKISKCIEEEHEEMNIPSLKNKERYV